MGIPRLSNSGAMQAGAPDWRSLHDLLNRSVAQIGDNLRQAASRAAELCQQAFMPQQPSQALLLAVRRPHFGRGPALYRPEVHSK